MTAVLDAPGEERPVLASGAEPAARPEGRRWWAIAGLLLAVAVAVRVPAVVEPDSEFHPTRQYRAAVIARDLAYDLWGHADPGEVARAEQARAELPTIEPPVAEGVAAVLDADDPSTLWRIRVVEVAGFLAGLLALTVALRRHVGDLGSLVGLGAGGLLPYGLTAMASFQPEPLLVGGLCAATALALAPVSARRATLGIAAVGGLCGLLKVTALPVAGGLVLARELAAGAGVAVVGRVRRLVAPAFLLALPVAAWLVAGLVVDDFLRSQTEDRFFPELVLQGRFYAGWWGRMSDVFGAGSLAVAALGTAVAPPAVRRLAIGSAVGVAVAAAAFAYHTMTHDYYALVALPLVVVGVSAAVPWLAARVAGGERIVGVTVAALAVVLAAVGVGRVEDLRDEDMAASAAVVEGVVPPGDVAVGLTLDYGYGLTYRTTRLVRDWPTAADRALAELAGRDAPSDEELLARERGAGTRWFVVGETAALPLVPSLVDALSPYAVAACEHPAIVLDLDRREPGALERCAQELGFRLTP